MADNRAYTIFAAGVPEIILRLPHERPTKIYLLNFFGDPSNTDVVSVDTLGSGKGLNIPIGDSTPRYLIMNSGDQLWAFSNTANQILYVSVSGGI